MEKLKAIIKWIAVDGLLHFLVCHLLMVTVFPMFPDSTTGAIVASSLTAFAIVVKELYDMIAKSATSKQCWHDIICGSAGMLAGALTWLLWCL